MSAEDLKELGKAVLEVWEVIKDIARRIVDVIYEKSTKDKQKYNWTVPKDMSRKSQVLTVKRPIPKIRSNP